MHVGEVTSVGLGGLCVRCHYLRVWLQGERGKLESRQPQLLGLDVLQHLAEDLLEATGQHLESTHHRGLDRGENTNHLFTIGCSPAHRSS